MSKSSLTVQSYIALTDSPKEIQDKIKRAVTDSGSNIEYSSSKPALKNLINIYASFTDKAPDEIAQNYSGIGYAEFKKNLATVIIDFLSPIQTKYKKFMSDEQELLNILTAGKKHVHPIAQETFSEVRQKMGFSI